MKICKVKFKNIHSLKGEHEIDFENGVLGEAGLFVITGATGTGKSSILDVITLALFNRIPRIDSPITESIIEKEGVILTKNAPDCFAEIEYEVKGIKYRSNWSIRRTRTGSLDSRKQDLTDVETNQIIVSGIKDVVKKNEELIGLNFDQFVQSMILAQGQFSKLLLAKKDERNLILEKITGSSVYRKIGMLVFERHKEVTNLVATQRTKMGETVLLEQEAIDSINADIIEKKPLLEAENIKHKSFNDKKVLKESIQKNILIKEKNQVDWNAFLEIKKTFAPKENQLAIHNDLVIFRDEMNQIESHKNTASKLSETILTLDEHCKAFVTQKATNIILVSKLVGKTIPEADLEVELDLFLKQVVVLQNEEHTKFSNKEQEFQRLKDRLEVLVAYGISLNINDELTEKIQEELNSISTIIKQSGLNMVEEVLSKKTEFANLILPATQLIGSRQLYDSKKDAIETLMKSISSHKENLSDAIESEKVLKLKIDDLVLKVRTASTELEDWKSRKSLDQHRNELEDGKPCPLCGSENHPYSENIEEALINALQEKWEALSSELNQSEKEYSILNTKIKAFQDNIISDNSKLETLNTDFTITETSVKNLCNKLKWDLNVAIIEWEDELQKYQYKQNELDILEKKFHALKSLQDLKKCYDDYLLLNEEYIKAKDVSISIYNGDDINEEVNALKTNFVQITTALKGLILQIEDHQENLKIAIDSQKSLSEILFPKLEERGINSLEELKSKLLDEANAAQIRNESLEIKTREAELKTIIAATDKTLEEENKLDDTSITLNELIELLPKLSEAISELQKHIWDQEQKIKVNEENKQRLQKSQETLDALLKDLSLWSKMNALIGDAKGKTFSNFVQDLTLRQLIEYGNKRLVGFSDRYLLEVANESDALQVIDTYMGNSKRSVTSLSGGETFKLSLALAFGLSDLAARNVNIESLFIDEGFGSLDPESLDQAITILENMQNESNKSIGIISHVGELKDRIGTKIKLLKTGAGYSTIEIE
ncbi:SbcC/MukB-like Walker B domain-containing protein [Flavobacterium chungnamense]|uniref:AAA family ATPase n=1 Tax=Flavobacterium chungnamense TaxID=706182 RepID=A0ABP7UUX7_9FLAO